MKYNDIKILTKEDSGSEPLTLAEVKKQLIIDADVTIDDSYLTRLITAVRIEYEGKKNKSIVSKTITAGVKNPKGGQELLYQPIDEVSSVTDADGNSFDVVSVNGELMTEFDYGLIEYTTTGVCDERDKQEMLEMIAWKYEHRGDEQDKKRGIWLV